MRLFRILKRSFREWNDKDPFRESAVLAYYAIFSLPGLFVLIITLSGIFFGKEAVNQQVIGQIATSVGEDRESPSRFRIRSIRIDHFDPSVGFIHIDDRHFRC